MTRPSPLLSALFGVALLGVLVSGGLLAATVGGPALLLGYLAVVALLLGLGVARIRRAAAAGAPAPRACTCCGADGPGDHSKPVTVR